ncbi:MAG: RraA family protein [Chloroflexi bacterium]|nr:RraA family protein [Chloroflexota bacterium]
MPDQKLTGDISIDELRERYLKLHTAAVFDVLDTMGLPYQLLSHAIQPLRDDMVVAGPAVTSKLVESADPARFAGVPAQSSQYVFDELYPGCVLVMDVGYTQLSGPWGENTSLTAQVKGCTGVVIDGLTRDHRQVVAMGYPVFARGVTPAFARGRVRTIDVNLPVRIAGHLSQTVTVYPGDYILGDKDGIMVVPRELTVEVLGAAERVEELEEEQRRRLLAGEDRREVYRIDRYAHVRRLSGEAVARLMLR